MFIHQRIFVQSRVCLTRFIGQGQQGLISNTTAQAYVNQQQTLVNISPLLHMAVHHGLTVVQ